jgi:hypothetical protein
MSNNDEHRGRFSSKGIGIDASIRPGTAPSPATCNRYATPTVRGLKPLDEWSIASPVAVPTKHRSVAPRATEWRRRASRPFRGGMPVMKKWIIGGLALLVVIGAVSGSSGSESSSSSSSDGAKPSASANTSQVSQSEQPAAQAKPAAEKKPEMTSGQKNALGSAQSYIDMSGFSKKGLIQQLSSSAGEGFSKADATFAANHVDVDWKAEAVESAQSYLDMGGFSRQNLIEQLSSSAGEGFTPAQARYAVDKVY